jgi:hypothetical protein
MTSLPPGQAGKLAVLLDALASMPLSDGERASLTWLAGFKNVHRREYRGGDHPCPAERTGTAVAFSAYSFTEVHRPGGGSPGHRRGLPSLGEGVVLGGA